jgi:hypothetical protein
VIIVVKAVLAELVFVQQITGHFIVAKRAGSPHSWNLQVAFKNPKLIECVPAL